MLLHIWRRKNGNTYRENFVETQGHNIITKAIFLYLEEDIFQYNEGKLSCIYGNTKIVNNRLEDISKKLYQIVKINKIFFKKRSHSKVAALLILEFEGRVFFFNKLHSREVATHSLGTHELESY